MGLTLPVWVAAAAKAATEALLGIPFAEDHILLDPLTNNSLSVQIASAALFASSWNPFMGREGSSGARPFQEDKGDDIRTGPRGGRYRVTSKGRKSYDVE